MTTRSAARRHPVAGEALLAAILAACLAALLAWFGPPGSDLAAHVYQSNLFDEHGFRLWNNFWYEGRYSFVTYSLLYYPVAALLGIKLLAVASIAAAALAFSVVVAREWGPASRWSNRSFAVVWAGIVLSGAFPFALGIALGLLALWSLQSGRRGRFVALTLLTVLASPLAFVLLVVVLAAIAIARAPAREQVVLPAVTVAAVGMFELALFRLFPGGGRYPFSPAEAAAAVVFCVFGISLTWRVPSARVLRWIYVLYLPLCLAAYLIPSSVGENIARLRFAAVPLAVLTLSLRRWRPYPLAAVAFALALVWNLTPLAASYAKGASDPASQAAYWQPAIGFLHRSLGPSYRVEAVDTVGHWPAVYLPQAQIPITRGWFRQEDFPRNGVLYGETLSARSYVHWLRAMGVRYVVLPDAPLDYSARAEGRLLASGSSGLRPVFRSLHTTVFAVPSPRAIVNGSGRARVRSFGQSYLAFVVGRPGRYRIATSWSPYWRTSRGCLERAPDGMTQLRTRSAGKVTVSFDVDARALFATLAGRHARSCA